MIGILRLHIRFPECRSLKDKRNRIKPLLIKLRREFNISVCEMDLLDKWNETIIASVMIGNDLAFLQKSLAAILKWVESNFPEGDVYDEEFEYIS